METVLCSQNTQNVKRAYLVLTIARSHNGESLQKNPRMLSDPALHLWLSICLLSRLKNCTSQSDLWTAITFLSRENLIERIGPSLIESTEGGTSGLKGAVCHEKIYKKYGESAKDMDHQA